MVNIWWTLISDPEVTEDDIDKIYDDYTTLICTYSLLNKLLREEDKLDYQFEVVEKPFVKLPKTFKGKNHIIMDGLLDV